ncbi:MAG: hypothetical protein J6X89_05365 [Bacteroidales bacterium]|nr:hypothetical protein [Bacteroidales bacterium]
METAEKLRKIIIGLGMLAAILLIALVIIWINNSKIVTQLKVEKADLTEQMIALRSDYDSLQTSSTLLTDSLAVEREKVDQMIERLKKTEATNRAAIKKYENELGTMRSIMKHYIVQIDSLNNLNNTLRQEANNAKKDAAASRKKYDELRETTDNYAKQVEKGSVVKARGITLVGINGSGSETDRSSRVVKLRTDLSLVENALAKTGYRRIYIRVKGPDGILMTSADQKMFTSGGEEMVCSASREVDYQGSEVEMSIYFSGDGSYTKGTYSVDVYSADGKLGSADLILR